MSENSETKKKVFTVMREAVKLSLNSNGKDTILENKSEEYKKQLVNNLYSDSRPYQQLKENSLDFQYLLHKSREALPDLKEGNYSPIVRNYVNNIAYMFEGDLKSIAKILTTEQPETTEEVKKPVVEEEKVVVQEEITCKKCEKKHSITNEDIARVRINKSKVIECECGEVIMTILTPSAKRKKILEEHNEEKEAMDMTSLQTLNDLD